jgi:ribosome maturation protein SDO1
LYEKVFSDAKKGYEASTELMKTVFETESILNVSKIILDNGEIQFTQEYREQKRQEKLKRILDIIVRNAIDPRTHLPHPRNRIEAAVDEAKVRIDDFKDAEDQVNDVIHALKPILPIKFATKEIELKIPANYASKSYSVLERFGKITRNDWLNDGSLLCIIEIPAGLQNEFFDAINKLTQGNTESKVLSEK